MKKQGIIKDFSEIRSGVGKRGIWHLYKLILEDGFMATTFENLYGDQIGKAVILEVEKAANEKNGVKYENWRIIPTKPQKKLEESKDYEQMIGLLSKISAIVTGIDNKLDGLILETEKVKKDMPF